MKEKIKKCEKVIKILYFVYLFLFVFIMTNREFLPLGIDLRFVLLPVGMILIVYEIVNQILLKEEKEKHLDKDFKFVFLFFIWIFICNISWLWNELEINEGKFINEMILLINNFIGLIIFFLYKRYFKKEILNKIVIFSSLILVLSFVLIGIGFDITEISSSDEIYVYISSEEAPDHINVFGKGYRIGGFAQDPNYASFLLVIGIISALQLKTKKIYKIVIVVILSVALGFAASKTILIASAIGIMYISINKYTSSKVRKKINIIFLIGIICLILIILNLNTLKKVFTSTMTTRFAMWEDATELFEKSPIIGNGITSFRSYFGINNWYIQSHSTYMQILSETGLIGIILFFKIMYNNLEKKKLSNIFLIIVYSIFAINFETIALQFFVYIIYLNNIEENNVGNNEGDKHKKGKKALFLVNTLSNGGAERVCINMANELLKQNYNVDFILLNDTKTYQIDSSINIYDLKIKETNKIKKVLKILISIHKINDIILQNEKEEQYSLITSHLPMSNLLTRFSIIKDRAIYVLHTTMKYYDKNNSVLFKKMLKVMFNNKKIVSVSKGVEEECTRIYNMNYCDIKTIYNPINIEEINIKKNEKVEIEKPYILQVGRFSKEKRQDRMLDIFYKGEFYKKYQMVFCVSGDTEDSIKKEAKKLGIENEVSFLGWQDNIYKWIKNCEVVVSTSDIEAFPMTLIEAIACGAKVISSNCNFGPSEILLGKQADFLIEKDNIEEYIKKINIAINKYPISSKSIVEQCKSENVINEYIKFMNK